jgi:hypothetical protein
MGLGRGTMLDFIRNRIARHHLAPKDAVVVRTTLFQQHSLKM